MELGVSRRWSRSRNWPTGSIGLRGTEKGWDSVSWSWKGGPDAQLAEHLAVVVEGARALDRVGDDFLTGMIVRERKRNLAKKFKGVLDNEADRKEAVGKDSVRVQ